MARSLKRWVGPSPNRCMLQVLSASNVNTWTFLSSASSTFTQVVVAPATTWATTWLVTLAVALASWRSKSWSLLYDVGLGLVPGHLPLFFSYFMFFWLPDLCAGSPPSKQLVWIGTFLAGCMKQATVCWSNNKCLVFIVLSVMVHILVWIR